MCIIFFFNDTATTEIYTLSLHDALPILVEGITEFLPVSSTGHMIIIEDLIKFKEGVEPISLYTKQYKDAFTMIIQLGAILAIVVLYWDKIKKSFRNFSPSHPKSGFKFWLNIAVAAVPAGVIEIGRAHV